MTEQKARDIYEFTELVKKEGGEIMQLFERILEKGAAVKKMTNYCKHKLTDPTISKDKAIKKPEEITVQARKGQIPALAFDGITDTAFLTVPMAARYLNTNGETVARMAAAGQLFAMLIHGYFVIPQRALDAHIAATIPVDK